MSGRFSSEPAVASTPPANAQLLLAEVRAGGSWGRWGRGGEPQGWVSGSCWGDFHSRRWSGGLSWLASVLGGSSRGKMRGESLLCPPAHPGDAFSPLGFAASCAATPSWFSWGRGTLRLQRGQRARAWEHQTSPGLPGCDRRTARELWLESASSHLKAGAGIWEAWAQGCWQWWRHGEGRGMCCGWLGQGGWHNAMGISTLK